MSGTNVKDLKGLSNQEKLRELGVLQVKCDSQAKVIDSMAAKIVELQTTLSKQNKKYSILKDIVAPHCEPVVNGQFNWAIAADLCLDYIGKDYEEKPADIIKEFTDKVNNK